MSTYYMAPSGTTSTELGTIDNPHLSFSAGLSAIKEGDTLVLMDGTYQIGREFSVEGGYNYTDVINITTTAHDPAGRSGGRNILPLTTFAISGSSPENVIISGEEHEVYGSYGWWTKLDPLGSLSVFTNVTTHNITFRDITSKNNISIFSTTGEDTYEFRNCIFDRIRPNAQSNLAIGALVGPSFTNQRMSIIFVDKYNGRGIFKNCIFKKLSPTGGIYMLNANVVRGCFDCLGVYLRFANCTIETDYSGGDCEDPSANSYLFYNGYMAIQYTSLWVDKVAPQHLTETTVSQVDTITFAGFDAVAGGSTFTISTSGEIHGQVVWFAGNPLYQEDFTISDTDIGTPSNAAAATAMVTKMAAANTGAGPKHFTAVAVDDVLTLTAVKPGTGWLTSVASTSNIDETMTHSISAANYNPYEYYKFDALATWPVSDVKLINCVLYNTYPTRRYLSRSRIDHWDQGGEGKNIHGDTAWHNSEFINCSFYNFENYTTDDTRCISKFTNCLGTVDKGSYTSVDPLFVTSPSLGTCVTSGADYSLRPSSPVIGNGIPVPDTFYDLDKPTTLGTQL